MKKQSFFIIVISLIFYSCGPNLVSNGRTAYKEYFNKTLKDPASLVIHSEEIIAQDEASVTFVLDVGAKNSFGGMVRQTYTIRTIGKDIVDVTKYDIRILSQNKSESNSKNESKENNKLSNFTYKAKMIPVAGFYPEKYIGKELLLEDSCIYVDFASNVPKMIQAIQKKDANEAFQLGGLLPKGDKIKIISIDGNTFKVNSNTPKRNNIYIEQSAIF